MSQADKVNDMKIEIQKLLGQINRDMTRLKGEVASLHHILEGDASLPMNAKMVNERLMIAAKEAGINLDDLEIEASNEESSEQNVSEHDASEQNVSEHDASEQDESERENGTQESPEDNEQTASTSNAASLAAAADKLTKAVKRTLR